MKYFTKERFTLRQVVIMLTIVFSGVAVISYGAVTIPNTFTPGKTISSGEVNSNFTALANQMPAVKTGYAGFNIAVESTYTHIVTLSVTVPANGFVYLSANGSIQLGSKSADGFSEVIVGITDDNIPDTPISGNAVRFYLDKNQVGSYQVPYGANAVFPLTAGAHTFYINACRYGDGDNNVYVCDNRLTAMFIPNALP